LNQTISQVKRIIRIGTRDSRLAVWQAEFIASLLSEKGVETSLEYIKSDGEMDLVSPLYEMGVQGIFTKTLDIALLNKKIDIAVHSLKDVPTQLPENLMIAAIPERASWKDVLVYKSESLSPDATDDYVIATSSLRRKAQWLHRYPTHRTDVLRGNINTRLEKVNSTENWGGALFAAAGIDRINLDVPNKIELDWMLPAPAQGALAVVCRNDDPEMAEICAFLNHKNTALCVTAERQFLRTLMGGCTMPIAALAEVTGDYIHLKGNVFTIDGKNKAEVELQLPLSEAHHLGAKAAEWLLQNGGAEIVQSFKQFKS
jgi:hydroxymethylbilane synthase